MKASSRHRLRKWLAHLVSSVVPCLTTWQTVSVTQRVVVRQLKTQNHITQRKPCTVLNSCSKHPVPCVLSSSGGGCGECVKCAGTLRTHRQDAVSGRGASYRPHSSYPNSKMPKLSTSGSKPSGQARNEDAAGVRGYTMSKPRGDAWPVRAALGPYLDLVKAHDERIDLVLTDRHFGGCFL